MSRTKSSISRAYDDRDAFELSLKIDDRVEKGLFYWIIGGVGCALLLVLGGLSNLNSTINTVDKELRREIGSVKDGLQNKIHELELRLVGNNTKQ